MAFFIAEGAGYKKGIIYPTTKRHYKWKSVCIIGKRRNVSVARSIKKTDDK